MTLILAAGNALQTVLAVDRRLTVAEGTTVKSVEEDANKAIVLQTPDARVVVAFTGIASINKPPAFGPPPAGSFRTAFWIAEALRECVTPDFLIEPTIERFRARAEQTLGRLTVPHPKKPLVVLFAGYRYEGTTAKTFVRQVYNVLVPSMESTPAVVCTGAARDAQDGEAYMMATGTTIAIRRERHMDQVAEVVNGNKPADAVVGRLLKALREIAHEPASNQMIGTNASTFVLPIDRSQPVIGDYHPSAGTSTYYFASSISASPETGVSITLDPQVRSTPPDAKPELIHGPKLGRNAPCWCGSGKKYKRCHGR